MGGKSEVWQHTTLNVSLRWISAAIFSLLLYAVAVWSAGQHLKSQYNPERYLIAAAVSHTIYGAPIGAVYDELATLFVYKRKNLQRTIEELKRAPPPREALRALWWVIPDGMGIVMVTVVSFLFDVFGVTVAVFPILAVGLSAVSVACLCLRFSDSRLMVVPLHFSILTLLLLSPVSRDGGGIDEFSAGSARYLGLLAILPALHLCLEIFDRKVGRPSTLVLLAAAIQIIVFALCLNVRGGSAYLILATGTLFAFARWSGWAGARLGTVLAKIGVLAVGLAVVTFAIDVTAPNAYRQDSRVSGVFWHRLIISLGMHPDWPFGDVALQYPICAQSDGSALQPGVSDQTGNCIWLQHVRTTGMHEAQDFLGLYGATHERLSREAFLQLLLDYPDKVLATFAYYKVIGIPRSLLQVMYVEIAARDAHLQVLCLLGLLVIFWWSAWHQTAFRLVHPMLASLTFLAWSFVPIVVAWPALHTLADVAYWLWAMILTAVWAAAKFSRARVFASSSNAPL